jgi:hypothetical protein
MLWHFWTLTMRPVRNVLPWKVPAVSKWRSTIITTIIIIAVRSLFAAIITTITGGTITTIIITTSGGDTITTTTASTWQSRAATCKTAHRETGLTEVQARFFYLNCRPANPTYLAFAARRMWR